MKTLILIPFVMFAALTAVSTPAQALDFNSYFNRKLPLDDSGIASIADNNVGLLYAISMIGTRVGGGECTDLVKMALSHSGARQPDFHNFRRYVWGAIVTGTPRPGDVIQFEECIFKWTSGNSWGEIHMDHHTAIVVSSHGTVLELIHQNAPFGGPVKVEKIDRKWRTQGRFIIWRPVMW